MPASPGTAPSSAATASSRPCSCCGSTRPIAARRAALSRRHAGDRSRSRGRRPARQDPARDARRRDGPHSARSRSAATTAPSMPRRSSSCWPAMYYERTGDHRDSSVELWPNIEARPALDATSYGDRDGDGFVEYYRETEHGLANQGWKDSHDSIFHADGSAGRGADRAVEVQAYVFAAKQRGRRDGAPRSGRPERSQAAAGRPQARPAAALRGGLLVRGARHLRAGARRRQAALPGADLAMPAMRCSPASPRRSGPRRVAETLLIAARLHSRLGRPHASRAGEARYNPMSLPQRLGLAARQRDDRARPGPLRPEGEAALRLRRRCSTRPPTRSIGGCPSSSAASSASAGAARRLSGRVLAPGVGGRSALRAPGGVPRPRHVGAAQRDPPERPGAAAFLDEIVVRGLRLGSSVMDVRIHKYSGDVALNVLRRSGGATVLVCK